MPTVRVKKNRTEDAPQGTERSDLASTNAVVRDAPGEYVLVQ